MLSVHNVQSILREEQQLRSLGIGNPVDGLFGLDMAIPIEISEVEENSRGKVNFLGFQTPLESIDPSFDSLPLIPLFINLGRTPIDLKDFGKD